MHAHRVVLATAGLREFSELVRRADAVALHYGPIGVVFTPAAEDVRPGAHRTDAPLSRRNALLLKRELDELGLRAEFEIIEERAGHFVLLLPVDYEPRF